MSKHFRSSAVDNGYVLCLTGHRTLNKRMALFIEGVHRRGQSIKVLALPRGEWRLDRTETPIASAGQNWMTMQVGSNSEVQLSLIMCFHWCMLPIAVLMSWWYGVSVLYDEHDHYELNTQEGSKSGLRNRALRIIVRAVHSACLPFVTLVTCIHMYRDALKTHLQRWQSSVLEMHNFPAEVWSRSTAYRDLRSKTCFVYIGGVFREKGVCAAADAFQRLPPGERSKAELHIFGTGDSVLLAALQGIDGIVLHKSVTPSEFRSFASANRCCGLSLLANTPRYQLVGTNCTKLYEYLALGMPVIATRVGEFPEFIEKHKVGLLIEGQLNAAELLEVMRSVLQDAKGFEDMSKNAITLMRQPEMTWESEWQKLEHTGIFDPATRAA